MIIEFIKRLFFIIPGAPKTVQISPTNRCNFNCKMCQRNDLKVTIKDIDFENFKKIVSKLKGAQNIILTGWGEPFMHPKIILMIKLCKDNNFNVRLTSNGSMLDDQLIKDIIESKLDAITFSVDAINPKETGGGHIVSSQLNNIKKLSNEIIKRKSNLKIYLQSVYFRGKENNLYDIAKFAIENNLNRIRISRMDIRFNDYARPSFQQEKKLINNIEKIIKGSNLGFDFLPHIAFDGILKKIYRLLFPLLHVKGKYCLRTFGDMYVNVDGKATPCCALPLFEVGDMLNENLDSIWKSKEFKDFRKTQKKVCGRCDILSIKPYNKN